MSGPTLGMAGSRRVEIDVARLLADRLLVNASSGAGKSWLLRRILEQTHGQVQHLVIDPEGEFYTMRERFDYILARAGYKRSTRDAYIQRLVARRLVETSREGPEGALWFVGPRGRVVAKIVGIHVPAGPGDNVGGWLERAALMLQPEAPK